LRSGGVEDERVDNTQPVCHRRDQFLHLGLVGDISGKRVGRATAGTDRSHHIKSLPVAVQAVYRHGEAVAGQASCDRAAETP
jgi:hypothetical protein